MRHLVHMASFSAQTNMHARNLAIVWAPNLLRCVCAVAPQSLAPGAALGGVWLCGCPGRVGEVRGEKQELRGYTTWNGLTLPAPSQA